MVVLQLYVKSGTFFFASACSVLFEITFLFKLFSLTSKYVFFTESEISFLLAKFACANITAKFYDINLLNSCADHDHDHYFAFQSY